MNTLQNIKTKECCCGFTLRTGSLILFWISLIFEAISILIYLTELLYLNPIYVRYSNTFREAGITFLAFRSSYYLITSIAGLVLSISGIYGIQKNAPKYLTFGLYYLGYYVVFNVVSLILLIVAPTTFAKLIMNGAKMNFAMGGVEFFFVSVVAYIFIIAIFSYLWVIVRSCRDAMVNYGGNGRTAGEIPDPSALGYSQA